MFCYRLADRLHKTLGEIEALSFEELSGWIAYINIEKREEGPRG